MSSRAQRGDLFYHYVGIDEITSAFAKLRKDRLLIKCLRERSAATFFIITVVLMRLLQLLQSFAKTVTVTHVFARNEVTRRSFCNLG